MQSFTLALQYECEAFGIDVQLISPYFVRTKMNAFSTTLMAGNLFVPNVETYGRWAVFTLGKSSETTGYWAHAIQVCSFTRKTIEEEEEKKIPQLFRKLIKKKFCVNFSLFTMIFYMDKKKISSEIYMGDFSSSDLSSEVQSFRVIFNPT